MAGYAKRIQVPVRVWGGGLAGESSIPTAATDVSWRELLQRLAMVSPGDGHGMMDGLRRVPPGSVAIVAVAIADGQSIQAIGILAKKLGRLLVVTLEGFGEPTPGPEIFTALQQSECYVVRCRQGHLEDALVALQQVEAQPVSGRRSAPENFPLQSNVPDWELVGEKANPPAMDPRASSRQTPVRIDTQAGRR